MTKQAVAEMPKKTDTKKDEESDQELTERMQRKMEERLKSCTEEIGKILQKYNCKITTDVRLEPDHRTGVCMVRAMYVIMSI